ncbi:surface lipoprotein assembly modifier [Acinetobacter sp. NIPH 2699]|uniref:surface lipoprotein assembly modifier n=1 Tax=Acinetobacter sp. NIPH 2699 TaxID=2923433 RepID=UPI001F4A6648|nr:surface lipoprotein assembly modifier [Acinetobacter sp. NIPH 2699]MCH7336378.1 surface lipoprotein assembly modifier [Acinetobacter sp. NIPH 2699]
MKRTLLCCLALWGSSSLYADDDTQLRLNQSLDQHRLQQQHELQQQGVIRRTDELPRIVINGQVYEVEKNQDDLAKALYLAVMQKQWGNAAVYLKHYQQYEGYDQALTDFAEGALARAQGELKLAEQKFKSSLNQQPNNLICELELARVLFEQQKNKEAARLFTSIQSRLAQSDRAVIPAEVEQTVNLFVKALDQRDNWQGSLAIGSTYASNLNSSSEQSKTWMLYGVDQDGNMVIREITRSSPKTESAAGMDYEASLIKRFSIHGNHGIALRGLAYGQSYDNHTDYNESTLNINAGYSFFDLKNQITIAPLFEHKRYANDGLYDAWGGRIEWMRFVSADTAFKLEAEIKDLDYHTYKTLNGQEHSALATFWKVLPEQWTLFGGLDVLDRSTQEKYLAAYQQQGVRFGLSKPWDIGINTTLLSSYRWRQFDQYAEVFQTRRHDFEQNYTFVVQMPRFQFYGMTPNLTYRYNHNNSNVDWLYSYDKHHVSLKLEHRF